MSTKAVVVWLVIAVVLGAAAIYLLTSSSGSSSGAAGAGKPGDRLVEFIPTELVRVEVNAPDRPVETIQRSATNAEWVIVLPATASPGAPVSPAGREWPLLDSRIQAFLTMLGDTRVLSAPGKDAQIGLSPTTVHLHLRSGKVIQIELADRTIGGSGLAKVTVTNEPGSREQAPKPMLATIEDRLHQMFRTPGPRAWRDSTALRLARSGADPSRITMRSNERELELGKVDGCWSLRKPFSAPADRGAVERLVRNLGQVQIVDFLDSGPGTAATGLGQPAASITIEQDRRDVNAAGDVKVTSLKNELVVGSVGGLGSAGADRLFGRIDADRIVLIDGKSLADLQVDPGSYVWPHPSTASPTDVGTILMEVRSAEAGSVPEESGAPRLFKRELAGWNAVAADGSASPLVDTRLADVNRLLAFLTGSGGTAGSGGGGGATSADAALGAPHIGAEPPSGVARFVPFARIALLSAGSAQLEQIEVGEAGRGLVSFRTGDVYRTYPEDRLPKLINELRARAKDAGVPIEGYGAKGPEGRDPVK